MTDYKPMYCTPDDVFQCIRMIDPYDINGGVEVASDMSHPTFEQLQFRICVKEDEIDHYTGRSWRPHKVKDRILDINTYWHDINGQRATYWAKGGNFVQLERDVLEWDTTQGDKLELRSLNNTWITISPSEPDKGEVESDDVRTPPVNMFWFDYSMGRLFIRTPFINPTYNAIRISYRYGKTEEVPASISRCCALMTALTVINEDIYTTKIGVGGDLGSARNDMKKAMQDEINSILMMYRTCGPVYSLYG